MTAAERKFWILSQAGGVRYAGAHFDMSKASALRARSKVQNRITQKLWMERGTPESFYFTERFGGSDNGQASLAAIVELGQSLRAVVGKS